MATITSKKDYIFHAAAMDPHTSSELSLAEIEKLVDALIAAYGKFCPRVRCCPYEQL